MKIYYAAPLHDQVDRDRNEKYVGILREAGHQVFNPGSNGVWEEMVKERMSKGIPEQEAVEDVRSMLFKENEEAIKQSQCVVAYFGDRQPSEGGLWEMGYAYGLQKPVVLCNFHNWRFNLMPQFGSNVVRTVDELRTWLRMAETAINDRLQGAFK